MATCQKPFIKEVLRETRTVGVGFVDGDNYDYPALEAADMLAYEVRKQTGKQVGTNENTNARELYRALTANKTTFHSWRFFDNPINLQIAVDAIERGSLGADENKLWEPHD